MTKGEASGDALRPFKKRRQVGYRPLGAARIEVPLARDDWRLGSIPGPRSTFFDGEIMRIGEQREAD